MISKKLDFDTKITGLDNLTVGDFWSWAYSNIFGNINRSVFAEFLVGSALDITNTIRREWDSVDLSYKGKGIEVKSAAYLQDWNRKKSSSIVFGIGKKRPWHRETNIMEKDSVRSANCYVFCLYTEDDKEKITRTIMDAGKWQFFILSTEQINNELGNQKTVSLGRLKKLCEPVEFNNLKEQIDHLLGL